MDEALSAHYPEMHFVVPWAELSNTLKRVIQTPSVNPFHGIFNEGFGGMMPTPAERHSIHRAVDSVLLESSAHNRFAISAESFDG